MPVEHIEFLVEEPSMETTLRCLVPKMVQRISFEIYPHQCKGELLKRLPQRLRGYSSWLPSNWRIVVVVDRDGDECRNLLARLDRAAKDAGLRSKSRSRGGDWTLVNRLAIEELEAWFFGDWRAVCEAYPRVSANLPSRRGFRDPDAIGGGTWESFERALQQAGYFRGGLRKIEAASAVTERMDPARNKSKSFQKLRAALMEIAAA